MDWTNKNKKHDIIVLTMRSVMRAKGQKTNNEVWKDDTGSVESIVP